MVCRRRKFPVNFWKDTLLLYNSCCLNHLCPTGVYQEWAFPSRTGNHFPQWRRPLCSTIIRPSPPFSSQPAIYYGKGVDVSAVHVIYAAFPGSFPLSHQSCSSSVWLTWLLSVGTGCYFLLFPRWAHRFVCLFIFTSCELKFSS